MKPKETRSNVIDAILAARTDCKECKPVYEKYQNDFLFTWGVIRGKRAKGLISEEEYLNWKYKLQIV